MRKNKTRRAFVFGRGRSKPGPIYDRRRRKDRQVAPMSNRTRNGYLIIGAVILAHVAVSAFACGELPPAPVVKITVIAR